MLRCYPPQLDPVRQQAEHAYRFARLGSFYVVLVLAVWIWREWQGEGRPDRTGHWFFGLALVAAGVLAGRIFLEVAGTANWFLEGPRPTDVFDRWLFGLLGALLAIVTGLVLLLVGWARTGGAGEESLPAAAQQGSRPEPDRHDA